MKKVKECIMEIAGYIFVLFASPIIRLSGLDQVDDVSTEDEIEKSKALAEKYRKNR